ncbi:MAG: precorrin-3B C(17)-methyltransferase [Acidimicrobiales bacterium]|nr:precorrin-3B C(17)-methyltransferase [Acidimicrobiales bacterium]
MNICSIPLTKKGAELAKLLPYEVIYPIADSLKDTIARQWEKRDALVLYLATGAAVRLIAPLIKDKQNDPSVVCVSEDGKVAVALLGGHSIPISANELAIEISQIIGTTPVITTATDLLDIPGLDILPNLYAEGDIAKVSKALVDRQPVNINCEDSWTLPISLTEACGDSKQNNTECTVVVTSKLDPSPKPREVYLRPRNLFLGVGTSKGAQYAELAELVKSTLLKTNLSIHSLASISTIAIRKDHPAVVELSQKLNIPISIYEPEELGDISMLVPNPSEVVENAVGTKSVAEACALKSSGLKGELVVEKVKSPNATVAIAKALFPKGTIRLVGLGPSGALDRSPRATRAVLQSEIIVGFSGYVDQAQDLITPFHQIERWPIGKEIERVESCFNHAALGREVALVCSGDAGIYAMASLVLEIANQNSDKPNIEVIPGITAALTTSSLLGAPLGHDHAILSLSDLHTPWQVIENRLRAALNADMVVVLYNPRSNERKAQFHNAMEIAKEIRGSDSLVGVVTDAYRDNQSIFSTTLAKLDEELVSMTTCLIIGSSKTISVSGYKDLLVTPRGYEI